ncbi:MAG: hypothetical protein Fur0034_12440 [Desulfuromonadia bacterium]
MGRLFLPRLLILVILCSPPLVLTVDPLPDCQQEWGGVSLSRSPMLGSSLPRISNADPQRVDPSRHPPPFPHPVPPIPSPFPFFARFGERSPPA